MEAGALSASASAESGPTSRTESEAGRFPRRLQGVVEPEGVGWSKRSGRRCLRTTTFGPVALPTPTPCQGEEEGRENQPPHQ